MVGVRRRLVQVTALVAAVTAFGTAGYMLLEGWSFLDALFMTVITVATIGYGETRPLDTSGRWFTIALIVGGIGVFTYAVSELAAFLVGEQLTDAWGRRRMERRIAALTDHVIVCGGGDTGRHIAAELLETGTPFLIVELDPSREAQVRALGPEVPYLIGDASDTDLLIHARVPQAKGLIACMPSDKDNLFAVIAARELNPTMRIVTRVVADSAAPKLSRAGADSVVLSRKISALRLSAEMLRPYGVGVLDAMLHPPYSMWFHEIPVGPGGAGQPLGALRLQERSGVVVFALQEVETGQFAFNPPLDRVLSLGDTLVGCANATQLAAARRIAQEG